MKQRSMRRTARAAFTLMEVLVVVAIIVILALSGGVIYTRYLDDAKKDRARIDVMSLTTTVETFYTKFHDYPANLLVLTQPMPDGGKPYLEAHALVDPWGREYRYVHPGQRNTLSGKPDIWSDGPRPGDPAGIIGNWPISAGVGGH